jgi:hypothetical protein
LGAIAALELLLLEMGWSIKAGTGVAAAQQAMAHGVAAARAIGI